ncbi:MAG: glycosyltransferase [Candidatus Limnocylindrales bacterium]|nr:glycosyltransferase [Chloroflexota bacterium]
MLRRDASAPHHSDAPGVRVVMDVRPLQERHRAPITAAYLDRLLKAFAADPVSGESFAFVLRGIRDDPTAELEAAGLPVAARRHLPPTSRLFRSAGLTLDSFLLRGAELHVAAGAEEAGAAGTLYHTAGGAVPIASGLPVVATLLDLAPWELPGRYAATAAARFGHRLRARSLRDAARVIVASRATAEAAQRLLHLSDESLAVVPLAADPAFGPQAADAERSASLRDRFDLPPRYLVFAGRYDARKDFATLFDALAALREQAPSSPAPRSRPADLGTWPPVVVLAGAAGDGHEDSPAVARHARRAGVADLIRLTPQLEPRDLAALQAGALAHVQPALSDGTGLAVSEALALGIPVICSRVGALPEAVGAAGIIVEPADAARLAVAIRTIWEGGAVARQVARRARQGATGPRRTWADVARETRAVYAAALLG